MYESTSGPWKRAARTTHALSSDRVTVNGPINLRLYMAIEGFFT